MQTVLPVMIAVEEVYIYNRATSCLTSLAQHVV